MNINDLVHGHVQAKKVLERVINRSQERHYKKCVLGLDDVPKPLNCLLVGQSGTGKTHLLQSMAKIHKFPLLSLSATDLMPTGNTTGINANQLRALIQKTAIDYTKKVEYHSIEGVLNQLVVFIDEFDKLGLSFDSTGNWNKQVQACFLAMFEELNGITWVFAGAFSQLYEQQRVNSQIGFFSSETKEKIKEITDADLLRCGITPEMLGRIPLIVQLDTFSVVDYIEILKQLPLFNPNTMDAKEIATKAHESGQGIRSLIRQLELTELDNLWVKPIF